MKLLLKNSKIIILILVMIAGGLFLLVNRSSDKKEPAAMNNLIQTQGELFIPETTYDFGNVPINKGLVSHEFVLNNNSNGDVKIGKVETSCMCTEAFLKVDGGKEVGPFGMGGHGGFSLKRNADLIVKPGEQLVVKVEFDPAAHGPAGVGFVEREIMLDAGKVEPLILSFKATITP